MLTNNNNTICDAEINYIYDITVKFDKTSTATSNSPIKYATAQLIRADITSLLHKTGKKAENTDIVLQITPPSADVTVFNMDGSVAVNNDNLGEGEFLFTTDDYGQAVVYFASLNNAYQNITVYSLKENSSTATEYVVFFGDYSHADTHIPAPSVDLDEALILQISETDPYFYVSISQADSIDEAVGYSCIAIVNGTNFRKMPYREALESGGFAIPSAWLSTQYDNQLSYFIENDKSATVSSSPTLVFKAGGMPYNHPRRDTTLPRRLMSRPYLNTGQTSITTSNYSNLYVKLDRVKDQTGDFTYNPGDTIIFTIYINGYHPKSNDKNVNVIQLEPITLPLNCPTTASTQIPASILEGFGANNANTAGRYDIDYVVIPPNKCDPTDWSRPMNWLKGNINTSD